MTKPIRVLHVLKCLDFGGIETWLMHLLRNLDQSELHFDFLLNGEDKGAYAEEAMDLGARIFSATSAHRPIPYAMDFARAVRTAKPDIVHCHAHHYSGYVLLLARLLGVRGRIAHSHNDTALVDSSASLRRKLYLRSMESSIRRNASLNLAVTRQAAKALFPTSDARILNYVVDLRPYEQPASTNLRSELGLREGSTVLVHVGIFKPQKNHAFALRVLASLREKGLDVQLLFVGDGSLRKKMETECVRLGIAEHTVFAGARSDVVQILRSVGDVFLFPSLWEGFGLVLLEAQAAGVPCVISDVIPPEADVIPGLVERVSLDTEIENWTSAVVRAMNKPRDPSSSLALIRRSPHNIDHHLNELLDAYTQSLRTTKNASSSVDRQHAGDSDLISVNS